MKAINNEAKKRLVADYGELVDIHGLTRDIELAKSMSTIASSAELYDLSTRLLELKEALDQLVSQYEVLAKLAKSKSSTLQEFYRLARDRAKEVSIMTHEATKQR